MIKIGDRIPEVVMPVRIPASDGSDAEWKYLTTTEQFAGKKFYSLHCLEHLLQLVLLFSCSCLSMKMQVSLQKRV